MVGRTARRASRDKDRMKAAANPRGKQGYAVGL
jgi:hypothetical protein